MSNDVFTLHPGTTPLLVSVPHAGTRIPDDVRDRFVDRALHVEDSDWHLDRLYAFVRDMGAGLIVPTYSRYLIDLNRPPDNAPMYAGANNTELCPTHFFTGEPLYREGRAPDIAEVARRRERYWRPYHEALAAELDRIKSVHGHAIVFDGHSIKSELPWLFEGRLPDLNLGTASGASCPPSLRTELAAVLAEQRTFTHVVDGRFKGGYITRHYGRPRENQHAVQLEMCFACYMEEYLPFAYDDSRADRLGPVLAKLVETMIAWKPLGGE
jgi:N-formylglutamate deformylase